jgi:hypothetical protein
LRELQFPMMIHPSILYILSTWFPPSDGPERAGKWSK